MFSFFGAQGRLASRHPWAAIGIIALLTVALGAGLFIESGPAGDQAQSFLPPESELAMAQEKLAEDFGSQSNTLAVQIIVRGDSGKVLSPTGLQEVLDGFAAAQAEPAVQDFLVPGGAFSVAHMLLVPLGVSDYEGISQSEIDDMLALLSGQVGNLLACGEDVCTAANTYAMLGFISLDSGVAAEDDAELVDAQLAIEEALDRQTWNAVEARSFSGAKLNQDIAESQGTSTNLLMGLALAIILVLLVVFYRTGSDVALSIGGLVLTIMLVFGLQGILGPGGMGLIGADSPFAMMIPILLIGLTVDYALQVTGRYREHLGEGDDARTAMYQAVRHSGMPLLLAAATTAISFLTNLTSSMAPMRDFGIVAALGVLLGWFVMITFVPAARTLLDARRERRGRKVQSRHMAEAIPGVGAVVAGISAGITRRPGIFVLVAAMVSLVAVLGAANVSSSFSQTDFMPSGTESYDDLIFLQEEFAGGGATATILIEGDLGDADLLRNLVNMEMFLADTQTRPAAMTGPVQTSVLTLALDWAFDSGIPGDKYDPSVAPLLQDLDRFFPPEAALHALFDKLQALDPVGYGSVIALHADGPDRTIITIPVVSGDSGATTALVSALAKAWDGDPAAFFLTGSEVLNVAINNELTDSQTQSVVITIFAALALLMVFFGITEKRPALGVITVLPIALVVVWVLGTMYVLGISYNIMTALITALTIGVGVDYTIHITHRFLEEHAEGHGIAHAVSESLKTTGGALIGSALTTALGFGVLLFSPLVPMQQFGGLTALTILYSLVASFVVLPPMLVLWALYHEWRAKQIPEQKITIETAPIREADWIIAGVRGLEGTSLRCPKCKRRTFVPTALAALHCPTFGCTYESKNPHHTEL